MGEPEKQKRITFEKIGRGSDWSLSLFICRESNATSKGRCDDYYFGGNLLYWTFTIVFWRKIFW